MGDEKRNDHDPEEASGGEGSEEPKHEKRTGTEFGDRRQPRLNQWRPHAHRTEPTCSPGDYRFALLPDMGVTVHHDHEPGSDSEDKHGKIDLVHVAHWFQFLLQSWFPTLRSDGLRESGQDWQMRFFGRPVRGTVALVIMIGLILGLAVSSFEGSPGLVAIAQTRPSLPDGFGLGVSGNDTNWMKQSGVPWTYRYQYLTGGVNTGSGWATWNPDGGYVTNYLVESERVKAIPVFTYYQLLISRPSVGSTEPARVLSNLANSDTMRAYYTDFLLLMRRLAGTRQPVVVHLEPDLNGFAQQAAIQTDNRASSIPAAVSSSGVSGLEDLPNTYQGFQQALFRLRDRIAPQVLLATHVSAWSTGEDVGASSRRDLDVDGIARKTAAFMESAGLGDLVFVDPADRDSAFQELINRDGGARWWDSAGKRFPNFERYNAYLASLNRATGRSLVLWQIPVGNTLTRSQNNTWNHHQDNRVQYWLAGYPSDGHLQALVQSGVVALLFGRGADGNTSFDDAAGDGITNPEPIGENTATATVSDDDGGLLRTVAARYYQQPLGRPVSSGSIPVVPASSVPASSVPASSVPASSAKPAAKPAANTTRRPVKRRSTKRPLRTRTKVTSTKRR
jgi:hypothetical protein